MELLYWSFAAILLSVAILAFGFWFSKDLSGRRKRDRVQRFAVAAMFPFAILFMFPPYVSEYSGVDVLDELQSVDSQSVQELSKQSAEQARYINRLRKEVVRLRKEVSDANRFYNRFVSFFTTGFFVFTIVYPFRRVDPRLDQEEGESEVDATNKTND